jgi:hypothetical protein
METTTCTLNTTEAYGYFCDHISTVTGDVCGAPAFLLVMASGSSDADRVLCKDHLDDLPSIVRTYAENNKDE